MALASSPRPHDTEHVTAPHVIGHLPGRTLNSRECAKRSAQAPSRHRTTHFQHAPILRDEHDVDRELHEERVDCAARRDDHGRALGQRGVVQETRTPTRRVEGGQQHRRDDSVGPGVDKLKLRRIVVEEMREKMRHGRAARSDILPEGGAKKNPYATQRLRTIRQRLAFPVSSRSIRSLP